MQHHCKLLIICKANDIGSTNLESKLLDYFHSNQEEITIYVIDHKQFTYILHYEQILQYLYSLAYNVTKDPCLRFKVVFQDFNPQFLANKKYDTTINLGTDIESNFNVQVHAHDQKIQFKQGKHTINQFKRGANGGTFDHLHIGHKLLLSLSLITISEHLTIGLTGENLLKNKKQKEFLQSYKTRWSQVREFCFDFRPNIEINISELQEPAGPTKDGVYEVLILTEETYNSLDYINNLRQEQNLNKLDSYVMGVMQFDQEMKISSSQIRQYIQEKNKLTAEDYQFIKDQWQIVSNDLNYFESIIIEFYSQRHRYYHTLHHVFDLLRQIPNTVNNLNNVILAIFFHDLVYYPKIHDNEEKSEIMFQQYAKQHNIDDKIISIFILQTKGHSIDVPFLEDKDLEDLKIFLDLDLSILSSNNYIEYANNIRQEYIHIPEKDYKIGRSMVMEKFLEREQIFYTMDDSQARKNIKQELMMLSK